MREQLTVWCELLDAIERGVRRINIAGSIEGDELRPRQSDLPMPDRHQTPPALCRATPHFPSNFPSRVNF